MIVESGSPERTEAAGRELAALLTPGGLVLLEADLAAGKTTFVRGLLEGLGGDPAGVSSPTFVIVQTYPVSRGGISRLHHVDLYRLAEAGPEELRETGLPELLSDEGAVTAVEWPVDDVLRWLPRGPRVWRVRIAVEPGGTRRIEISEIDGPGR